MAFKYNEDERTSEDISRNARFSGGSYDTYILPDIPTFKPKEGENVIRILPRTWKDTERWGVGWHIEAWVHYNVGADKGTYLCLDKMKGEPCPVCEARPQMEEDEARDLRAGARLLCWVIDRNNEKAGPLAYAMPAKLFRDINSRSVNKKDVTPIKVDSPTTGRDITFNREGTGLKTDYGQVSIDQEPSPIAEDERREDRWAKYVEDHPLPSILNFYDAAHIEKMLSGGSRKEAVAEEEEDRPRAPARAKLARDDDDEEVSAPKRRRAVVEEEEAAPPRRRVAAAVEEEEGEEESDPPPKRRRVVVEDDEGEAPVAKTRRARTNGADDEGEDEPAPKRRRAAAPVEEEEESAPPPKRRKPAAVEEDDEIPFDDGLSGKSVIAQAKAQLAQLRIDTSSVAKDDPDYIDHEKTARKLGRLSQDHPNRSKRVR